MKRTLIYAALLVQLSPLAAYALGLGNMTLRSALNQPFDAEIELIDVDTPLAGVKINVASVEDFEQVGLERAYVLDFLTFMVEKSNTGKPIIRVRSAERITEPYIELLVDLAWAQGQVYRAYTILLDPPEYELVKSKKVIVHAIQGRSVAVSDTHEKLAGVVEKEVVTDVKHSTDSEGLDKQSATYGPTLANETIWQIAQRYRTPDLTLQQVILAIVGTNPDAFAEGNLNGLKIGSKLEIPSTEDIRKVSATAAKLEVFEHDTAWQAKQPIKHVLLPPYIDSKPLTENGLSPLGYPLTTSKIPSTPVFSKDEETDAQNLFSFLPKTSSLLSASQDSGVANGKYDANQARIQTEMELARSAIESVREANDILRQQLQMLQAENKRLQQQLTQRDQVIQQLRKEVQLITLRTGIAGEANTPVEEETSSLWPWILFLLILAALAGGGYRWYGIRTREQSEAKKSEPKDLGPHEPTDIESKEQIVIIPAVVEPTPEKTIPVETIQEPAAEKTADLTETPPVSESAPEILVHDEQPLVEETMPDNPDDHILEFEPGLTPEKKESDVSPIVTSETKDEHAIEFDVTPISAPEQENPLNSSEEDEFEVQFEPHVEPETDLEADLEPEFEKTDVTVEPELDLVPEFNPEIDSESEVPILDAASEKPLKSYKALDTLLDLAKTYMSMQDYEAARQSLQEVSEHGNEKQKQVANQLLEELDRHNEN